MGIAPSNKGDDRGFFITDEELTTLCGLTDETVLRFLKMFLSLTDLKLSLLSVTMTGLLVLDVHHL
jgi:hypothetical protein